MPLVRIDLPQSITPQQRSLIGDSDSLRIDPSYLGIQRSAAAFIIDITLSAGHTVELKSSSTRPSWIGSTPKPTSGAKMC